MSQSSRLLIAAAAGLAAVVLIGLGLRFATSPNTVGPAPSSSSGPSIVVSPSPSPSPSASPSASPSGGSASVTRPPTTTLPPAFPKVDKFAPEGPLTLVWKVPGPATAQLATGTPAVAPDGRIWVPSGFDSKFWIFSAAGKYLESWGSQFDFVVTSGSARRAFGGIAFASDGSFWVADTGNHRVQHFDKDRGYLESIGDPSIFDMPVAVALNAGGDIYVDDAGRREIQQFNPSLAHVLTFASGVAGPYLDQEGHGWIDTNALPNGQPGMTEYKPDGSYQGSLDLSPLCAYPAGLTRDPDHNQFFACMSGSDQAARPVGLIMADDTGTALHFWTTGGAGIAIPPQGGAIYITMPGSADLSKYALP